MNNSLGGKVQNEIAVEYMAGNEKIKLTPSIVQRFIAGDSGNITLPEFKLFSELCKVRQLNPFLKEAYCIKYGNSPAQIVVGKDAILKRAIIDPDYDGMESGIIVQSKETGEITERKGTFYIKSAENLVGGWANVYRKNWSHPIYSSVAFDEVAQRKKDGALNTMWGSKGATMVEKVAKVRALREAFVERLGGMYDAAEKGVVLPDEMSDYPQAEMPEEMPNVPETAPPIDVMPEPPQEISINEL